jgi:hypothetical protein
MKSAAELLQELGLDPKASTGASKALVRHLQKALQSTTASKPPAPVISDQTGQLSFDAEVLGHSSRSNKTTRRI